MLSDADKETIRELSEKYHVQRVLLFGSNLDPDKVARDIDFAVEGIDPYEFFDYYGDLILRLSKPVDLIDLCVVSKFVALVRKEGLPIYG